MTGLGARLCVQRFSCPTRDWPYVLSALRTAVWTSYGNEALFMLIHRRVLSLRACVKFSDSPKRLFLREPGRANTRVNLPPFLNH